VLGDLHDAIVAAEWLDAWAEHRSSDEEQRGAEALAAAERESAEELRTGWRAVWDELEAPDLRSWM
jgi:CHAD domain-containing protein